MTISNDEWLRTPWGGRPWMIRILSMDDLKSVMDDQKSGSCEGRVVSFEWLAQIVRHAPLETRDSHTLLPFCPRCEKLFFGTKLVGSVVVTCCVSTGSGDRRREFCPSGVTKLAGGGSDFSPASHE